MRGMEAQASRTISGFSSRATAAPAAETARADLRRPVMSRRAPTTREPAAMVRDQGISERLVSICFVIFMICLSLSMVDEMGGSAGSVISGVVCLIVLRLAAGGDDRYRGRAEALCMRESHSAPLMTYSVAFTCAPNRGRIRGAACRCRGSPGLS